jgi:ribA/ribD-fused uncharacterized protein
MKLKKPEEYGILYKDGICLFQKSPLSQWWGSFKDQNSNFRPCGEGTPFCKDDPIFNCCEQFMMAVKAAVFEDKETYEKILKAKSAKTQKTLGRAVKNFDPAKWDLIKFSVVYCGNYWKFSQNEDLKDFLLSFPKDTIFAEAAPWDKIWGTGLRPNHPNAFIPEKWPGQNLLGKAISHVHNVLSNDLDFLNYYETRIKHQGN